MAECCQGPLTGQGEGIRAQGKLQAPGHRIEAEVMSLDGRRLAAAAYTTRTDGARTREQVYFRRLECQRDHVISLADRPRQARREDPKRVESAGQAVSRSSPIVEVRAETGLTDGGTSNSKH